MKTLILNPWPFGDGEEVELYWHGAAFMNDHDLWMIKCLFQRPQGTFTEAAFPFGTLPGLKIGHYYVNGRLTERMPTGSCFEVGILPDRIKLGSLCKSYSYPKRLYAFDKPLTSHYGNQYVLRFDINGINYYIPCAEIVRSILAPSKLLANQIVKPDGLDQLIAGSYQYKDKLEISFTEECDPNSLKDDTVSYFAWLRYDKTAFKSWSSVYQNMLLEASQRNGSDIKSEFRKGIPIKITPPFQRGGSTWRFRGLSFLNHVLILELIHRSGLDSPFSYIEYYHPKLEKLEGDKKPRYHKDPDKKPSESGEVELDFTGEGAESFHGHQIADQQPMMFSFKKKPYVKRKANKTRRVHTGEIIVIGTKESEETDNTATTQDWVLGGKIPQIEFPLLKMVDISMTKGLEEFLKMLDYMQRNYKQLSLLLSIVALPRHKGFSQYENGGIRPAAIVRIDQVGQLPCYIVEIGRADHWSISTLVIKPVDASCTDSKTFEMLVGKLLFELVDGNGHWDKGIFGNQSQYSIEIAKHMSDQAIPRWAERIVEKVNIHNNSMTNRGN